MAAKSLEIEPNSTLKDAQIILVDSAGINAKFDYLGDEDWFVFYGFEGRIYNIVIPDKSIAKAANPAITIFNAQGEETLAKFDFNFAGAGETIEFRPTRSGLYYLKITNEVRKFNSASTYTLTVFEPFASLNYVNGLVLDQCTGKGVNSALVLSSSGEQVLTTKKGEFGVTVLPGSYTFTASQDGYVEQKLTFSELRLIDEPIEIPLEFKLMPRAGCGSQPAPKAPTPEQVVSEFDATTGILLVKDIRIGDQGLEAVLQIQADGNFKLLKVTPLAQKLYSAPAYFDFTSSLANVPYVFFNGQVYSIQLLGKGNNIYALNTPPVVVELN